jgi:mRNA interferase MazF
MDLKDIKTENDKLDIFDEWSILKKCISVKSSLGKYHEREIWWCSLGKNIGNEQDGKNNNFERPVLVLKKWNKDFFIGIPMTTKNKVKSKDEKFYYKYFSDEENQGSYFMLTQVRVFISKRLVRKLNFVREFVFVDLKKHLSKILFDI